MTSPAPLPLAATRRGTIFGGRLDCFVLEGGQPVITVGRVSTIETRTFTDLLLTLTPPIYFTHGGDLFVGAAAEGIVDALIHVRADKVARAEHRALAGTWLRELVAHGLFGKSGAP